MKLIQISAGRGPIECSWVVWRVFEKISDEAQKKAIAITIVEKESDTEKDTYKLIIVSLNGENVIEFCSQWIGTIQWTVQSPFRPHHKRKNWFVSVNEIPTYQEESFSLMDVKIETLRSSGAGGQHVNKTESGVRVHHLPSKTSVLITSERSQHQNKSIALAVLFHKLKDRNMQKQELIEKKIWHNHNELIRGNPIRRFT